MVILIRNLDEMKQMMITKKIRFLLMLVACCFTTMLCAETLNRVVAIVNDDVITQSELRAEMNAITMQLRASGRPVPHDEAFKTNTLNHLIDKTLQLQIAKQLNITISDKELNTIIGRIASQNNMTTSQLLERIQQEGMNAKAYKENLREQLLLQKVQQQEVASKITITPQEVDRMMNSPEFRKQLVNGKASAATKKEIESRLLQEKFEAAGKNWLSKLRGLAYIDIKKDN